MSYLHCHTNDCHWSQDDWWSWKIYFPRREKGGKYKYTPGYVKILPFIGWGYNPISAFLSHVFTERCYRFWQWYEYGLVIPRFIKYDYFFICERRLPSFKNWVFSWSMILWEFKDMMVKWRSMKWPTYESWKKDYDSYKAVCPKCGLRNFDID